MPAPIHIPEPILSLRLASLFALELEITAVQQVGGDAGAGVVGVVGGGRFEGERLNGRVLEGGSDWQRVLADGTVLLDCRIVLETEQGALIAMEYRGVRSGAPAGAAPVPGQPYLRISPFFQTRSPDLAWLNRIVAIGAGHRPPAGPVYNIFEVL